MKQKLFALLTASVVAAAAGVSSVAHAVDMTAVTTGLKTATDNVNTTGGLVLLVVLAVAGVGILMSLFKKT